MRQTSKVEGTKIAQAAKDLNVTSVTIRRYISEFNIETTSDENGIKVLPDVAMEELKEIRKLKEDGHTNPKVMEILEEKRAKLAKKADAKPARGKAKTASKAQPEPAEEEEDEAPVQKAPEKKKPARRSAKVEEVEPGPPPKEREVQEAPEQESASEEPESTEGRVKHSLTCQTCGKVFEHMNPRLRDCLDCYRAKRKERRRGGAERHKNVIQHPLAQQAANRQAQQQVSAAEARVSASPVERETREPREPREPRESRESREPREARESRPQQERIIAASPAVPQMQRAVRNYRKAIEETRHITGSLKRRLERPDLPEGERRWLEQIYAYQLILHQGWRHLAEYKAATQQQGKSASDD